MIHVFGLSNFPFFLSFFLDTKRVQNTNIIFYLKKVLIVDYQRKTTKEN